MDKLYDAWAKRNPQWEKRYEEPVMKAFTDYGIGTSKYQESRGKIFGAGYEAFIVAFFIGLYFGRKKPLVEDRSKLKCYGQPIQYWGNLENRLGRTSYGQIRKFMFAALVARTDIDFIGLDKGESTVRKTVDQLIETMEQYANFGFNYIVEKMEDDQGVFFKEMTFLDLFLSFTEKEENQENDEEFEDL